MRLLSLLLVPCLGLVLVASGEPAVARQPVQAVIVQTGKAPCGSSVRGRWLWVAVYETGKLLRIDSRGHVAKRLPVGRSACRVAVGPGAVWVARDRAGEVVRIDRRSGRVRRTRVGSGALDVVLAAGSAWVSSYDTGNVARLGGRDGSIVSVSRDGPNPAGLTACGGRVWFGHGRQATWLSAIDPTTTSVERVELGATTPSLPRCVSGELWVTTSDSVLRLDARTGVVRSRLRIGGTPSDIAAGPDGLVWVTDKERSLVFRATPTGERVVDSFAAGPGAFALARLGRSVWVTSFAGSDVRRFDP